MRRAGLGLLVCALVAPAVAQDVDPAEAVLVEVVPQRDTWYVGERVRFTLRVAVDRGFRERHLLQPFRRELDLPVEISAPWLSGRDVIRSTYVFESVSLAVNGEPWGLAREEPGPLPSSDAAAMELSFPTVEPETVDLRTSVRLTYATTFRDDFVEGRIAVDPRTETVEFSAGTLRVLPLPEEGRPPGFSGVIGECTISARPGPPDATRPDVFVLEVVVRSAEPVVPERLPSLAAVAGLHVLGTRATTDAGTWRGPWVDTIVRHELEVTDPGLREIPAIPFVFFDPIEGAYRTERTEPLTIPERFLPARDGGPAPDTKAAADEGPGLGTVLLVAVVALLLALGAILARRRLRAPVEPSAADRARAAARRALDAGQDPADVLAGWLAARLGCAPAAVISPDLESRLRAAGEPPERAATLATLQERLVATRYGGAPAGDGDLATLRALLDGGDAAD